MTFNSRHDNEEVGFLIMGLDYSYIRLKKVVGNLYLSQVICEDANKNKAETESDKIKIDTNTVYLQVKVSKGGICEFFYSLDNKKFKSIGKAFKAREGRWIGSKIGFLALREGIINDAGSLDIDWIRFRR